METKGETRVDINPDMLILARESRGLTQTELAKRLNISQGKISKIEAGVLACNADLLQSLSDVLHYRPSFFTQRRGLLGLPVSVHGPFRKKQSLSKQDIQSIQASINISRHHVECLLNSVEVNTDLKIPYIDPDQYDGDIEEIANLVRRHLLLPSGPINNLVEALENAGCIIITCDFKTDKVDGLSLRLPEQPPLIFLRKDVPGDRQRFTIAHELGHIVMHFLQPNPEMEDQANLFAGAFLLPKADIAKSLRNLTIRDLATLKSHWKVSMQALLYRAKTLRTMTENQIRYLWMQLSSAGYRKQEPVPIPVEKPKVLDELLDLHRTELGYSNKELAEVLHLYEDEFLEKYCNVSPRLKLIKQ